MGGQSVQKQKKSSGREEKSADYLCQDRIAHRAGIPSPLTTPRFVQLRR
jgi:hypothetical protein